MYKLILLIFAVTILINDLIIPVIGRCYCTLCHTLTMPLIKYVRKKWKLSSNT